jgi:Co/Zn/Cd efflux system component
MLPLITEVQINSITLVLVAVIGIVPATLAAIWSRRAKNSSEEAAEQVRTNGGMSYPDPNVNDHIKYQTGMLEELLGRQAASEKLLEDHIAHSAMMDQVLADVYTTVMPVITVFDKPQK